MDLLLNDLSIHRQFQSVAEFQEAIQRIVAMRDSAHRLGSRIYCRQDTVNRWINATTTVYAALQTFTRDEKSSLLAWLGKHGPFWEEAREHSPDLWLEAGGEVVTETAVGEAAYCAALGIDRRLVSFAPSQWESSPVTVTMLDNGATAISVANYWALSDLAAALQAAEPPIGTWRQLEAVCRARFQLLRFSAECFRPLEGQPFVPGAANHIRIRLAILDRLMGAVDDSGHHTPEANRLLQQHFTGAKAWFSDSSTTEKRDFEQQLTFPHPDKLGETLFCPWHGKVNHPPFRIHFSWPVSAGEALYIVYVGRKITIH